MRLEKEAENSLQDFAGCVKYLEGPCAGEFSQPGLFFISCSGSVYRLEGGDKTNGRETNLESVYTPD